MAQWYEYKGCRRGESNTNTDCAVDDPPVKPPGGDVFLIQIRFRKIVQKEKLINQGGRLVVKEESDGPLIVKSFYVKRSDLESSCDVDAENILYENLERLGVILYPNRLLNLIRKFQKPILSGGLLPYPNNLMAMIRGIRDFALGLLTDEVVLEQPPPATGNAAGGEESGAVIPFVFRIALITLKPSAATTALERFSFSI